MWSSALGPLVGLLEDQGVIRRSAPATPERRGRHQPVPASCWSGTTAQQGFPARRRADGTGDRLRRPRHGIIFYVGVSRSTAVHDAPPGRTGDWAASPENSFLPGLAGLVKRSTPGAGLPVGKVAATDDSPRALSYHLMSSATSKRLAAACSWRRRRCGVSAAWRPTAGTDRGRLRAVAP